MNRFRIMKQRARADLHQGMSVPALYIPAPAASAIPCNVRIWLKSDGQMIGNLPRLLGDATRAEPEDRVRFDLSEFVAPLRVQTGIVSVAAGEAYRLDFLYPADQGYQTARVLRLDAADATGLPVPA